MDCRADVFSSHRTAYRSVSGTAQEIGGDERIEPARRPFEFMLNALRLAEGFTLERFEARTGLPRTAIAAPLEQAYANGWSEVDGEHVRKQALGRRFGNDAIALFLAARGREPQAPATPAARR